MQDPSHDVVETFNLHLRNAQEYGASAQWESVMRELHLAKSAYESAGFPDPELKRQQVLFQLGCVERRFGRVSSAAKLLQQAINFSKWDTTERLEALGELAVVYQHLNDHGRAKMICQEQYETAKRLVSEIQKVMDQSIADAEGGELRRTILKAEMVVCRVVGNLGMANYHLFLVSNDKSLLNEAIRQMNERVQRSRELQQKLRQEGGPFPSSISRARIWESNGLDRLTLCLAADGNTAEAVKCGELSRQMTRASPDPTVRAMSRFFYGYALLRDGQRDKAMELFDYFTPDERCTCAIALCKEPSEEYYKYLKIITEEGVNLDHDDEQGYSALDYVMFGSNEVTQKMVGLLLKGLSDSLPPDQILARRQAAETRKHYRELFQECLRPKLIQGSPECIQSLRASYANMLEKDAAKKISFDELRFVSYSDFIQHERLPSFDNHVTSSFSGLCPEGHDNESSKHEPFIIFFSYRWIGQISSSGDPHPDDAEHTQYRRMLNAIDGFLGLHPDVPRESVCIWLDYACIDQSHVDPGVAALPLIIAQCNAMISLIDETYFERAWCAVEAVLMQTLVQSYGQHEWYIHPLSDSNANRTQGALQKACLDVEVDLESLKLSYESDRPKVAFLLRQSHLLGIT